ncbi:MAG: hypothetical protein DRZ80_02345 [Thermoprotei archaeon]|nr:MAG: hypothetical protein DRZ80_02345 [Thermoprotei archaeon]
MMCMSKKSHVQSLFQIPPHSHCLWCRRAIPEGQRFCSKRCERAYFKWKRKKDLLNIGYLIAGFSLMILALWLFG